MTPAGPERDKRIAELIGWREVKMLDGNAYGIPPYFGEDATQSVMVAPYSTDIATAMELWDEMRALVRKSSVGKIILEMDTTGYLIYCKVFATSISVPTKCFEHKSQTEAGAISGAWLKWKEEK